MDSIDPATSSEVKEDREVYEQLAKLQSAYNQVFALRTLLPDKLVNPTRVMLQSSDRSGPEKLAAQLKEAAIIGSKDIQKFKREYQSDEMRGLFQRVNATELPQGQDGWITDYITLVARLKGDNIPDPRLLNEKSDAEGLSDVDAIKAFRGQNPELFVKPHDENVGLPIDLTISPLIFRIENSSSGYQLMLVDEEKQSKLAKDILRYIQKDHADEKLSGLLTLLASYVNPRSQKCEKCGRIFDDALEIPLARKPRTEHKQSGWVVLHQSCLS